MLSGPLWKKKVPNPAVDECLAHRVPFKFLSLPWRPTPAHHQPNRRAGSHSTDGETKTWRSFISSYCHLLLFCQREVEIFSGLVRKYLLIQRLSAGLPASFLAGRMPFGAIGEPASAEGGSSSPFPLSETPTCLQPSPASSLPPFPSCIFL